MNKVRVLVLGASGFIGQHVTLALQISGWAIPIAAYHRSRRAIPGIRECSMDATDEAALGQAMLDVDAVVNCVAGGPASIVAGARTLFSIAAKQPVPPRIVYLSTMSVYGTATGEIDESNPLRGDLGEYSSAKVSAERFAKHYPRAVILRPGCVYGPGSSQWSERIASLLISHRLGNLGPAGDGRCNLVYIDDLVAAILQALQRPGIEGQAFNLSVPAPPTWNQYLLLYAQKLGLAPPKPISAARLAIETLLLAPFLKVAGIVKRFVAPAQTIEVQVIPPSLLRLFGQDIVLRSDKAEHMLGLHWTPINEGLTLAAAGFRTTHRA